MRNICVSCGNPTELPEGTEICLDCQRTLHTSDVICPNCGSGLEIMSKSKYNTVDGFGYSTIFHCNHCQNDWEKEEEYIAKPILFKRKYWG